MQRNLHNIKLSTRVIYAEQSVTILQLLFCIQLKEWTSGYAMVVHGRPKPLKIQVFGGHPSHRGRTAPIF